MLTSVGVFLFRLELLYINTLLSDCIFSVVDQWHHLLNPTLH